MSSSRRLATSATCSSRAASTKDCSRIRSVFDPRPWTRSASAVTWSAQARSSATSTSAAVTSPASDSRPCGAAPRPLELGHRLLAPAGDGRAALLQCGDVGARTDLGEFGLGQPCPQHRHRLVVPVQLAVEGGEPARRQQGRGRRQHVVEAGVRGPVLRRPPRGVRGGPGAHLVGLGRDERLAARRGVGQPGHPRRRGRRRSPAPRRGGRSAGQARARGRRAPPSAHRSSSRSAASRAAASSRSASSRASSACAGARVAARRAASGASRAQRVQRRRLLGDRCRPRPGPQGDELALLAVEVRRRRGEGRLGGVGGLVGGLLVVGGDHRPGRAWRGGDARWRRRPGSRRRRLSWAASSAAMPSRR